MFCEFFGGSFGEIFVIAIGEITYWHLRLGFMKKSGLVVGGAPNTYIMFSLRWAR